MRVHAPAVELVDGGVRVSFALECGAYATSVLRELLVEAPWAVEAGA